MVTSSNPSWLTLGGLFDTVWHPESRSREIASVVAISGGRGFAGIGFLAEIQVGIKTIHADIDFLACH